MKLWSITVMLKTPNSGARLLFNDEQHAIDCANLLTGGDDELPVTVATDDYGNHYTVDRNHIASVLFTDMAAECEGQKELEMLNAHMKADLFDRMSKDDKVKAMQRAMNPQGPIMPANGLFRQ